MRYWNAEGHRSIRRPSSCRVIYFPALKPPTLQERQMPNELPLPTMFIQRLVMLANSAGLRGEVTKGVSIPWKVPGAGAA